MAESAVLSSVEPPGTSHRRTGGLRRIVVVAGASLALLLAFAAPAQAGWASVSHIGGADAQVTFTFTGTKSVSLSVKVIDWKCNAHSAWGGVELYDGSFYPKTLSFWNSNGCGTTKSFSQTYTHSSPIIYLRVGADGDGRPGGYATTFGSYLDNPYT